RSASRNAARRRRGSRWDRRTARGHREGRSAPLAGTRHRRPSCPQCSVPGAYRLGPTSIAPIVSAGHRARARIAALPGWCYRRAWRSASEAAPSGRTRRLTSMVTIESTPAMAAKVYETMAKNLAVVRRRLGRPLTLADKVLLGHLDDPEHQEMEPGRSYLFLRPDRVVLQDVLGQTAMLQFRQTRRNAVAVPTTIHCDHLIQARVEG